VQPDQVRSANRSQVRRLELCVGGALLLSAVDEPVAFTDKVQPGRGNDERPGVPDGRPRGVQAWQVAAVGTTQHDRGRCQSSAAPADAQPDQMPAQDRGQLHRPWRERERVEAGGLGIHNASVGTPARPSRGRRCAHDIVCVSHNAESQAGMICWAMNAQQRYVSTVRCGPRLESAGPSRYTP